MNTADGVRQSLRGLRGLWDRREGFPFMRQLPVYFHRMLSSNDSLILAAGPGVTGMGLPSFW